MTIHFVCRGNIYRSRIAEAYLNSKNLKGMEVFSSGAYAEGDFSGSITWWALRIIFNNGLIKYMSNSWQKTNEKLLSKGDKTIFFENSNYEYCKNNLGFKNSSYEVWDVKDISQSIEDNKKISMSEDGFEIIKLNIDKLVRNTSRV